MKGHIWVTTVDEYDPECVPCITQDAKDILMEALERERMDTDKLLDEMGSGYVEDTSAYRRVRDRNTNVEELIDQLHEMKVCSR